MIQTVTEHDFITAFSPSDGFSYEGLKSLFQHFEWLENEWDVEEIELDVVAIRGEYEEYENLAEIQQDYSDIETIEQLREHTEVIPVQNTDRIIVRCF